MGRTFFVFVIFSAVGLGLEVIFTALTASYKPRPYYWMGHSSLLYMPLYGILLPIFLWVAYPIVADLPLLFRAAIYTPFFHLGEYLGMAALRRMYGESPTEENYEKSRFNIHSLTRLDYAPAFYLAAIVFDTLFRELQ